MFTRFMDMHSGGGSKEDWDTIYIEAPESEAVSVFYARFGHSPHRVTCTCCGEDYSVSESLTLEEATAYDRGCASAWFFTDTGEEACEDDYTDRKVKWDATTKANTYQGRIVQNGYVERASKRQWSRDYLTLDQYVAQKDVLVIRAEEVNEFDKTTIVPEQGYVWRD